MMYIGSMFFTVPSTGFVRMTLFNIFTGKTTHSLQININEIVDTNILLLFHVQELLSS